MSGARLERAPSDHAKTAVSYTHLPFDQKPTKSLEDMMLDWKDLSPRPYKKLETDPYTKARIILMNCLLYTSRCV